MVRYTGMNTAVKEIADRWTRGSRALLADSQPYGCQLAAMLRRHEHDNVACFFVLVELAKEKEVAKQKAACRGETTARHGFW